MIRARINRPGVTHRALGRLAGVLHVTIGMIANGQIKASAAVPKICEYLGIDLFEYLPLDDAQRRMLRALRKLRTARVIEDPFVAETESRVNGLVAQAELTRMRDTVITGDKLPYPAVAREPPEDAPGPTRPRKKSPVS